MLLLYRIIQVTHKTRIDTSRQAGTTNQKKWPMIQIIYIFLFYHISNYLISISDSSSICLYLNLHCMQTHNQGQIDDSDPLLDNFMTLFFYAPCAMLCNSSFLCDQGYFFISCQLSFIYSFSILYSMMGRLFIILLVLTCTLTSIIPELKLPIQNNQSIASINNTLVNKTEIKQWGENNPENKTNNIISQQNSTNKEEINSTNNNNSTTNNLHNPHSHDNSTKYTKVQALIGFGFPGWVYILIALCNVFSIVSVLWYCILAIQRQKFKQEINRRNQSKTQLQSDKNNQKVQKQTNNRDRSINMQKIQEQPQEQQSQDRKKARNLFKQLKKQQQKQTSPRLEQQNKNQYQQKEQYQQKVYQMQNIDIQLFGVQNQFRQQSREEQQNVEYTKVQGQLNIQEQQNNNVEFHQMQNQPQEQKIEAQAQYQYQINEYNNQPQGQNIQFQYQIVEYNQIQNKIREQKVQGQEQQNVEYIQTQNQPKEQKMEQIQQIQQQNIQ